MVPPGHWLDEEPLPLPLDPPEPQGVEAANRAPSAWRPIPEATWGSRIAAYQELLTAKNHMSGKPMWIDEGGWGQNFQTNAGGQACDADTVCGCADAAINPCMQADGLTNDTLLGLTNAPAPGYLVPAYLQIIASGVERFYWYSVGSDEWGSFADCVGPGTCVYEKTATAWAWGSMVQWLVGATLAQPVVTGTQTTTAITAKDPAMPTGCASSSAGPDYQATIAWDTAGPSTLACGAYTHYCALFEGNAKPFSAGTSHPCTGEAPVGPIPILLEP